MEFSTTRQSISTHILVDSNQDVGYWVTAPGHSCEEVLGEFLGLYVDELESLDEAGRTELVSSIEVYDLDDVVSNVRCMLGVES